MILELRIAHGLQGSLYIKFESKLKHEGEKYHIGYSRFIDHQLSPLSLYNLMETLVRIQVIIRYALFIYCQSPFSLCSSMTFVKEGKTTILFYIRDSLPD